MKKIIVKTENTTKNNNDMKAEKIKLEITIECLSTDTLAGMLMDVSQQIENQKVKGEFRHEDGDSACWEITKEKVEF